MPTIPSDKYQAITAAGGTFNITVTDPYSDYVFYSAAPITLVANVAITPSGAPTKPCKLRIILKSVITTGANTVTIFGTQLTSEQAASGLIIVELLYDRKNAAWIVDVVDAFNNGVNDGMETTAINTAGTTVTLDKNSKQWQRLTGSGTLTGDISVTFAGTFTTQTFYILYKATLTKSVSSVTLMGESLTASMCLYSDVLVIASYDLANTTFRTQLIQSPATVYKGQVETITLLVSFETGEQCDNRLKMGFAGYVSNISGVVVGVLANTDAGTIVPKNAAGTNMTLSTPLSYPLSSAVETTVNADVTADNTFVAGDRLYFTGAKTTAGGKVLLSITVVRT